MFMYASDPRVDPQRRREINPEHRASPHNHPARAGLRAASVRAAQGRLSALSVSL
jgi:hypothetical protein